MYIETDETRCKGICEIFPENKKDRKLLYKFYERFKKGERGRIQLFIDGTSKPGYKANNPLYLTIYKKW